LHQVNQFCAEKVFEMLCVKSVEICLMAINLQRNNKFVTIETFHKLWNSYNYELLAPQL